MLEDICLQKGHFNKKMLTKKQNTKCELLCFSNSNTHTFDFTVGFIEISLDCFPHTLKYLFVSSKGHNLYKLCIPSKKCI